MAAQLGPLKTANAVSLTWLSQPSRSLWAPSRAAFEAAGSQSMFYP